MRLMFAPPRFVAIGAAISSARGCLGIKVSYDVFAVFRFLFDTGSARSGGTSFFSAAQLRCSECALVLIASAELLLIDQIPSNSGMDISRDSMGRMHEGTGLLSWVRGRPSVVPVCGSSAGTRSTQSCPPFRDPNAQSLHFPDGCCSMLQVSTGSPRDPFGSPGVPAVLAFQVSHKFCCSSVGYNGVVCKWSKSQGVDNSEYEAPSKRLTELPAVGLYWTCAECMGCKQ